jgi:hypothetical protein
MEIIKRLWRAIWWKQKTTLVIKFIEPFEYKFLSVELSDEGKVKMMGSNNGHSWKELNFLFHNNKRSKN